MAGLRGFNECVLALVLHYSIYMIMVLFFNPEDEVAIGVHERIGPCDENVPIQTAFGMVCLTEPFLTSLPVSNSSCDD